MAKVSFFAASLAVWVLLSALAVVIYQPRIEQDLTLRSRTLLQQKRFFYPVTFSGRDATVQIPGNADEAARRALRLVLTVFGVRAAEFKIGYGLQSSTPPTPPPAIKNESPRSRVMEQNVISPSVVAPPRIDRKPLQEMLSGVRIQFQFDSASLVSPSPQELERLSAFLKDRPMPRVRVIGYTDSSGPADYNRKLSVRRAKAVSDFLSTKGISAKNLEIEGRGATSFVANNKTRAGRAKNRRVEFELVPGISEGTG